MKAIAIVPFSLTTITRAAERARHLFERPCQRGNEDGREAAQNQAEIGHAQPGHATFLLSCAQDKQSHQHQRTEQQSSRYPRNSETAPRDLRYSSRTSQMIWPTVQAVQADREDQPRDAVPPLQ